MVTESAQKILDAAADCLERGGAGHLRVDEVARRAALNKRMIYHYFGNKDGLVAAARDAQAGTLRGSRRISAATRRVLAGLFPAAVPVSGVNALPRLQRAARLILGYLLETDQTDQLRAVDLQQWQAFVLELGSLAWRQELPEVLSGVSDDSLPHVAPQAQRHRSGQRPEGGETQAGESAPRRSARGHSEGTREAAQSGTVPSMVEPARPTAQAPERRKKVSVRLASVSRPRQS